MGRRRRSRRAAGGAAGRFPGGNTNSEGTEALSARLSPVAPHSVNERFTPLGWLGRHGDLHRSDPSNSSGAPGPGGGRGRARSCAAAGDGGRRHGAEGAGRRSGADRDRQPLDRRAFGNSAKGGPGLAACGVADASTLPPDAPVEAPAIVPPGAPPKTVLTLFEKIAVTMAAQVAATEQDSQ